MLLLTVKINAKPGKGADLAALLEEMVVEGRKEPGVLSYDPYRSIEQPDTVFMYEVYQDQAALELHRQNPALEPFHGRLMEMLDGAPEMSQWQPAA